VGSARETGRSSPAQVVRDLLAAIVERREQDMLDMLDPQVEWRPIIRPARTLYRGRTEMLRYLSDLHAAYGPFRLDIEDIEAAGSQVTVRARAARLAGDLPPIPFASVFNVRGGLVTRMESQPEST
jgi:ketosteroid isomerase-like protein